MSTAGSGLTSSSSEELALRLRRTWSAPACSVRHAARTCTPGPAGGVSTPGVMNKEHERVSPARAMVAMRVVGNPRYTPLLCARLGLARRPSPLIKLPVPTTSSSSLQDSKANGAKPEKQQAPDICTRELISGSDLVSPPGAHAEASDNAAMKAQLDAATSQIRLLNGANEQTRRVYAALEEESQRLRTENSTLRSENDSLREALMKREEEIDLQWHRICELQSQLAELGKLVAKQPE